MKHYAAILSAPGFSVGICCNDDEVTEIAYLEPQTEVVPKTLLAKEAVRQLRTWLRDPGFQFGLPLAPAGTDKARLQLAPGRHQVTFRISRTAG